MTKWLPTGRSTHAPGPPSGPRATSAVRSCAAALRPGGSLIFSLVHPCWKEPPAQWAAEGCVAVHDHRRENTRSRGRGAPLFRRPLSAYLNLMVGAGRAIRRVLEPARATGARHAHVPDFIVVHALRS